MRSFLLGGLGGTSEQSALTERSSSREALPVDSLADEPFQAQHRNIVANQPVLASIVPGSLINFLTDRELRDLFPYLSSSR